MLKDPLVLPDLLVMLELQGFKEQLEIQVLQGHQAWPGRQDNQDRQVSKVHKEDLELKVFQGPLVLQDLLVQQAWLETQALQDLVDPWDPRVPKDQEDYKGYLVLTEIPDKLVLQGPQEQSDFPERMDRMVSLETQVLLVR